MKKNIYEVITIFAPNILEEKVQSHLKKIKNMISNYNGEILEEDHWDNKKLAYRINKFNTGIYHFIKTNVESDFVTDFRKYVTANDDIIRNSVIKVEKQQSKRKKKVSIKDDENEGSSDVNKTEPTAV